MWAAEFFKRRSVVYRRANAKAQLVSAVAVDSMAVVAERRTGSDTTLAVAPDEKAIFVDGANDPGLHGEGLIIGQITMLPEGRSLVMRIAGGLENDEGTNEHLAGVNPNPGEAPHLLASTK